MSEVALVLAVYLTQLVAGLVVVELLGARRRGRLARALLLGPAAIALQLMGYHGLGVPFTLPLALAPWWAVAAVLARRLLRRAPDERGAASAGAADRALAAAAGVAFVLLAAQGARFPVYRGDEVHNFAINARVFEVHGSLAPDALKSLLEEGHPEYPPLVALNEALLFLAESSTLGFAVKPFFALAWLAWALLVLEAVRPLAPPLRASVGLLALCVPELAAFATRGMADLRLTATVLLVALEARAFLTGRAGRALPDARAFAAAAVACALTKNEGLAVATLLVLALLPRLVRALGAARAGSLALVALALAWAWPAFKELHGVRDVYLDAARPGANADRLGTIVARFASFPFEAELGPAPAWGLLWPATAVALAVGWCRRAARRELGLAAAALAVHLGVYVAVFSATPHDLEWHLGTAGPRLAFHAAPWLVLVLVAGLRRRPGDALGGEG